MADKKAALNSKVMGDGCTLSPDFNFTECCNKHDVDYAEAKISRSGADKKLRQCIAKKGLGFYRFRVLPWVYWAGVRVFGASHYGNERRPKCKICAFFRQKITFLS